MGILYFLALFPFGLWGSSEVPVLPAQPLHGIYFTSNTIAHSRGDTILDQFSKVGGNMVIFDVQDANGHLAYPSNLPVSIQLKNRGVQIPDLAETVKRLHARNYYAVARFVLFKNPFIAAQKPAWTIKRKGTGSPFVSRDGPVWLDPANPELKAYLIDLAREIALSGVDEVQFDYVRFPESGTARNAPYDYTDKKTFTREQTILNFAKDAAAAVHFLGARVGLDIFGIVVWDNVSWKVIGQNVPELAKIVDVMYPMPYPSHFGPGWGGHRNPADEPYFFVKETTKKFVEQTKNSDVAIRPWLQGFALRVSRYTSEYVQEQIRGLTDIGIQEYAVWNARNEYGITFAGY